jgi:hypothetical protein
MKLFYILIAVVCFSLASNAQCYDDISVLNTSPDTDCIDGVVILDINFAPNKTGNGNSCVTVQYTDLDNGSTSINVPNLQGPRQIELSNIDCNGSITFIARSSPSCGGTTCNTIMYPDIQVFINQTLVPIELHSFSVKATKDQNALLEWVTSSEVDNDFFLIERSENGNDWETIGRIAGNGNSTSLIEYEFTDRNTLSGKSYYRLVDVDYAGNETESHIVSFDSRGLDIGFTAFPNPVKDELNLDKLELNDEVSIYSQDGKLLLSQLVNEASIYNFKVDLSTYQNGFYMIRVVRGQDVYTDRIVKN